MVIRAERAGLTIFSNEWNIRVRRRRDDPFGEPLWTERVLSWAAASLRVDDLARRLRAGELPGATG